MFHQRQKLTVVRRYTQVLNRLSSACFRRTIAWPSKSTLRRMLPDAEKLPTIRFLLSADHQTWKSPGQSLTFNSYASLPVAGMILM